MSEVKKSVRWYEGAYIVVLLGVLALSMTYLRPQRVGVVNLDRAVKEMGVWDRIGQEMREREAAAQVRLEELQQRFMEEDKALVARFKEATNEEEKADLQSKIIAHQRTFQRTRLAIGEEMQRAHRDMLMTFRERMRPAVQEAAARKRMDLVLEPTVVFEVLNGGVDITTDAMARAQSRIRADQPLVDLDLLRERGLQPARAPGEDAPGNAAP